jgi:hypothetical protein
MTPDARRRVHLSSSAILAASGLVAFLLFFLALLLPGQNIHGGTLTLFTLLFGLWVPPLCFVAGLVAALAQWRHGGRLGIWLNATGLILHLLWATGGLHRILGWE